MEEQKLTAAEQQLKDYLDGRAATDELFAQRYAKENKSLNECIRYIKGEAYKQVVQNCAFLTDEEVFGLAVHYYDEDNIVINNSPSCTIGSTAKPAPVELTEEKKAQAEAEAKRKAYEDMVEKQRVENAKAASSLKLKKQKVENPSLFADYDYETEE